MRAHARDGVDTTTTIEGLRNKFLKWKEAFESKGLKANLGKAKVMVCGCITKDGMSNSKADPRGVCSLMVKAKSALCLQCGGWIQGRCAGVKKVTANLKEILHAENVMRILERPWSRK